YDGTQEVAGAILAGTVTTLAVFLPAVFLTGMIKYLFEPLSLAAAFTIGASFVLALSVVPAYCATFLREQRPGNETEIADDTRPRGVYGRLLCASLAAPAVVSLAIVAGIGTTGLLWPTIGTELFPEVDSGAFEVRIKTTPGTRLEHTEDLVVKVEDVIKSIIPERELATIIANIGLPVGKGAGFSTVLSSNSGPDTAYILVNLQTQGRLTPTAAYVSQLRSQLAQEFPLEQFLFVSGGIVNLALSEGVPTPISVQVSAGSLGQCRDAAELIVAAVAQIPGTADVQIAQSLEYPQFDIQVDRVRAKYLGVDQEQVAQTILTALGSSVGYSPTIWIDSTGTDFFMGVQYESNEVQSLDELRNIPLSLSTAQGPVTIPLSNVATIKRVTIPGEIAHYNIARVNDIHVNVAGRDVGSVAHDVEQALAGIEFAPGVTATIRGPVETMKQGMQMLALGLAVAAVLVYLVLMAQFRSFVDPLIIMLAVPLGLGGVLLALSLTGTTLNIQSLMGTLMMIGVVVNNSILLVEFANRRRDEGLSPRDAALASAQVRLRPILMTSLTLVASMLPLTFQVAPGNEAMIPLARSLVGGMTLSTVLTLVLVPCVYTLVHRSRNETFDADLPAANAHG
ncbi:MAG: acriflavine resistance protein B, partial [Planctomycetales bacterium 12-60-4]